MDQKVILALGQMKGAQADVKSNEATMERMAAEAAERGAQIICFPELSQTGYFVRREELLKLAEPGNGPFSRRIAACAKKNGIWIIAGYAEQEGENLYNSCLLVSREGTIEGNVRKVHLWKSEKKRFQPGNEFPVFDTELGRLAILPCYDLEFPEPSRIAARKGAEILFCPAAWSAPSRERWELDLRANSLFNLLFTAGANYSDELCCGASAAAGPDGSFRAMASADQEEVITAVIDRGEILRQRAEIPYFEDIKEDLYQEERKKILTDCQTKYT